MDIRTAVQEDLPEILPLYRRIVADMKQKGIDIWNEYYPFEYLPEDIEDRRLYLLLAEGRICGAFALTAENDGESAADWTDPAAKAFYLDRLGVDPAFAGRGIGHEALRRAMDLAAKAGADWLRLFVVDRNRPAIRLYQKAGLSQVPGVYEEDGGNCVLREYGYEICLL